MKIKDIFKDPKFVEEIIREANRRGYCLTNYEEFLEEWAEKIPEIIILLKFTGKYLTAMIGFSPMRDHFYHDTYQRFPLHLHIPDKLKFKSKIKNTCLDFLQPRFFRKKSTLNLEDLRTRIINICPSD